MTVSAVRAAAFTAAALAVAWSLFQIYAGAWALMIAAMMLPTTLPVAAIFQRVVSARRSAGGLMALMAAGCATLLALAPGRESRGALAVEGPALHLAVWERLRAIPFGETMSYGAVATDLGMPGEARAIHALLVNTDPERTFLLAEGRRYKDLVPDPDLLEALPVPVRRPNLLLGRLHVLAGDLRQLLGDQLRADQLVHRCASPRLHLSVKLVGLRRGSPPWPATPRKVNTTDMSALLEPQLVLVTVPGVV